MAFGPESKNPRERRAYAHATIARARLTGTDEDFDIAERAVSSTGGLKAEESGFRGALIRAALSDVATRAIVVPARALLAPDRRRPLLTYNGRHESTSGVFSGSPLRGGRFGRAQTCTSDGEIINASPLTISGIKPPFGTIPTLDTGDRDVDVIGVRHIDEYSRTRLAHLVTATAADGGLPTISIAELYATNS